MVVFLDDEYKLNRLAAAMGAEIVTDLCAGITDGNLARSSAVQFLMRVDDIKNQPKKGYEKWAVFFRTSEQHSCGVMFSVPTEVNGPIVENKFIRAFQVIRNIFYNNKYFVSAG